MLNIIGQILGYIAVAGGCFLYIGQSRKALSLTKLSIESVWLVSYILQGGLWTMLILTIIALARQIVFYFRGQKKWASSKIWIIVFLICTLISPIIEILTKGFSWQLFLPLLLPTAGSIFIIFVYYVKSPILAKTLGLPASTFYFIYAIVISNLPLIVSGIVGLPITIVSLIFQIRKEKNKQNNLIKQSLNDE